MTAVERARRIMGSYFDDGDVRLYLGDCRDVLRERIPDASVDAVVTDPPYGLGFMGKEWDTPGSFVERKAARRNRFDHVGGNHNPVNSADSARTRRVEGQRFGEWVTTWSIEAFRVLKPGGHLLAFGGTRTFHRLTVGIEDAGFEVRDVLSWLYGSGFPKSLDVAKAIDKLDAADARPGFAGDRYTDAGDVTYQETAPHTPAAAAWHGWGTALKPAWEPIVLARRPLAGTVARNVLEHGTGALNIDGCRIAHADDADLAASLAKNPGRDDLVTSGTYGAGRPQQSVNTAGRWPANVVLDGGAAALLDAQAGDPSRFYYCAKASRADRGPGNTHPTVKPTELMRWAIRLVTPPGGTVLDPFSGSGTTLVAARAEGFRAIGVELDEDYAGIILRRLDETPLTLFGGAE